MPTPEKLLAKVNPELQTYFEQKIFPQYAQNEWGHQIGHIKYVIRRSLQFASTVPKIDFNVVYAVAGYHDLGHRIDPANHEKVSAKMFLNNPAMARFFSDAERQRIAEAIEDHRSKSDHTPRSIYGKIVTSADCNIDVDAMMHRTFSYRVHNFNDMGLEQIINEAQQHLFRKYYQPGYGIKKMYFDDPEFDAALQELQALVTNPKLFRQHFLAVNQLERVEKLEKELATYLKRVNPALHKHVEDKIFPQYAQNDKAHGLCHIREVIRRAFRLNKSFKLQLEPDLIFAIAAYHDLGKHIDSDHHEIVSAELFRQDAEMTKFFAPAQINLIAEAIEDHRSRKSDNPRSVYGQLISSADRNTRVEMVFVRSFFVGKDYQPEATVAEHLDFNFHRLAQRYSLDDPENMFFADQEYRNFLTAMRKLLQNEELFKTRYCEVNHVNSRDHTLAEEPGVEFSPMILI